MNPLDPDQETCVLELNPAASISALRIRPRQALLMARAG
jgi:hypothetical protein